MASAQQNPFLLQGMMGMMEPNPYTPYPNSPMPMPGYYGDPTDASGKPIQSFQDTQAQHDAWTPPPGTTTLNQTQQTPSGGRQSLDQVTAAAQKAGTGWASVDPNSAGGQTWAQERAGTPEAQWNAFNASMPSPEATAQSSMGGGGYSHGPDSGYGNALGTLASNQYLSGVAQERPTQAAAPAAPSNPYDMRQAYLTALSNPQGGQPMPVPGATVPQSPPLGQPSVMNAFLAAHPSGGGAGAGNYNNSGFFNTLNKLQGQGGSANA